MFEAAKPTSTQNISAVVKKQLELPVADATLKIFLTLDPLFQNGRYSDIDVQFGGNGEKTYEKFQSDVSNLSTTLLNSLSSAVEICEYNGSENEKFNELEYDILNLTSPLFYKRKRKMHIEYTILGAYAKPYDESEVYSTDEMVYNSKFHKKKLNSFIVSELNDCFKILSEIKYNKDNPYYSFAKLEPKELLKAKSAFIDVTHGANGSTCYRVVADCFLGYFFKIELQVPLYFSDEQSNRYNRLDIDESFLRKHYRKIMRERFSRLNTRRNRMFEVRGNRLSDVKEEEALIATFISSAKNIIHSIDVGDLKLSSVDKDLKILADTMAQLNILIEVAKEFYGGYNGIGDEKEQSKYIDLYQASIIKMMKTQFKHSGLPHMNGDLSLYSDVPFVNINISGDFDEPLDDLTIKTLAKTGGQSSTYKVNVDIARGSVPRSEVKLENGEVVFTAISNTFAADAQNQKDMQIFNIPGKKQGVAKLYIGKNGFEIVAKSGTERK